MSNKHNNVYGNIIGILIFVPVCLMWFYFINKKSEMEISIEKKKEVKSKVINRYLPETEKVIHLYFNDSVEYIPRNMGLNNIVEIGDSLYKYPNQWRYVIFKKCNPLDSLIYEWEEK